MDYFEMRLADDQAQREQQQDEAAIEWDIAKQQISQAIDEFGWSEVDRFVASHRPKGFTGTLPDGTELFNGISIN